MCAISKQYNENGWPTILYTINVVSISTWFTQTVIVYVNKN